ncbi:MAG TPA: Na-translocating system protein MpsC family protein [Solirubrobacteraceae bacterium]|nr:Na-translocating system protein MpsC family protein [Solirubrobacteraceae bacterium]
MASMEQLSGGRLNAALAKAVVKIHNEYVGRGPSRGHAFFRNNVVVVVMEETLTKAEHSLIASGSKDLVLRMRREFQRTMERDLVAVVEELTRCKVVAFMSDNHLSPDMAAEIFVLDRPLPGEPAERSEETASAAGGGG